MRCVCVDGLVECPGNCLVGWAQRYGQERLSGLGLAQLEYVSVMEASDGE